MNRIFTSYIEEFALDKGKGRKLLILTGIENKLP